MTDLNSPAARHRSDAITAKLAQLIWLCEQRGIDSDLIWNEARPPRQRRAVSWQLTDCQPLPCDEFPLPWLLLFPWELLCAGRRGAGAAGRTSTWDRGVFCPPLRIEPSCNCCRL